MVSMFALQPPKRKIVFASALVWLLQVHPAFAVELVARVVDAVEAKVFPTAVVQVRGGGITQRQAADSFGFVRLAGLPAGAYLLDVKLPDGREFVARTVLLSNRKTQFLDLDYARIVPPHDDDY